MLKSLKILTLIVFFLIPEILFAKIICVDGSKSSAHSDGSCWQRPYTRLDDALAAARSDKTITQIWIAKGVYHPFTTYSPQNNQQQTIIGGAFATQNRAGITINGKYIHYTQSPKKYNEYLKTFQLVDGVSIYGGFKGNEQSLQERDKNPKKHETILDGNLGNHSVWHVLSAGNDLTRQGVRLTLDRLTIRNGHAFNAPYFPTHFPLQKQQVPIYYHDDGGGLYIFARSIITLNDVIFTNNQAVAGGAIFVQDGSKLTLKNCTFSRNRALNGAAINARLGGPNEFNKNVNRNTTVIIKNCRFLNNKSQLTPVIFGNDNQAFPDIKKYRIFY
ncbi:MAG: right-handed parallel beta-helix repeat-containing protein [Candidatus Babeliales bacterium]